MTASTKFTCRVVAAFALGGAVFALQAQTAQTTPSTGTGQRAAAATPEQLLAAFQRADANQDGKLSRDEAAGMATLADRFDQLDKNKDGFLTPDEFNAGYQMAK